MPVDGVKIIIPTDNSSRCYLLSIDYFSSCSNKNITEYYFMQFLNQSCELLLCASKLLPQIFSVSLSSEPLGLLIIP